MVCIAYSYMSELLDGLVSLLYRLLIIGAILAMGILIYGYILYNNSISPTHVFFENNSIVFEATPLKLGHCILL